MATQDNNEWIAEEQLAEKLGVKRGAVRAERPSATSGALRISGNVVYWLKKTAHALPEKLGLAANALDEKTAPPTPEEVIETLTVASVPGPKGQHFGNPHLIRAKRGSGEVVTVRVVDSRKYVPVGINKKPMQLRARPAEEGVWWVLVGREPRFKGAW